MTGTPPAAEPGIPPRPQTGNGGTGVTRKPLTGRRQQPCSGPPKRRPEAYSRRPGAGPGRAPRRTHRHGESRRPAHMELPDEPPALTPAAARALLRILLKAHAAQTGQQAAMGDPEGKG
jgi:hypothetical protein